MKILHVLGEVHLVGFARQVLATAQEDERVFDRRVVLGNAGREEGFDQFHIAGFLVEVAYFAGFWSLVGQTPGMRLMRVRVRGPRGEPLSFARGVPG